MEYRLPDLGEGMQEAEIVRWLVQPGDRVARDQPVAQVQTDKALVDLPAPAAGRIERLGAAEGERVPVGALLLVIGEEDGAPPPAPPAAQGIVGTLPAEEPIPTGPPAGLPPAATPATRRLARELGVDLRRVRGTGPGGRITDADVRAAAAPAPSPASPAPAAAIVPVRGLRRRIAERMTEAGRIPRVTLMDEADAGALVALREELREAAAAEGVQLTYLALIARLAIAALRRHGELNAHYDEAAGEIRRFPGVDLGIATATGDGLLVPVIRGAERLPLLELARAIAARAEGARQRRLPPEDLRGSTFTITSPGPQGGLFATPLLNPPEVAILGIGRIGERAVVRGGAVTARPVLPFSLTFDHRALDGAEAAAFAATFARYVASPSRLLLD